MGKLSVNAVNSMTGIYDGLIQHKIYGNNLQWSMVQTLHAIQAGILAGAFLLKYGGWGVPDFFGGTLLLLGGVLTIILFFIVKRAHDDQKVNDKIRDKIRDELLKESIIQEDGESSNIDLGTIRWTQERSVRSHKLFYAIIIGFVLVDFALGGYFLGC